MSAELAGCGMRPMVAPGTVLGLCLPLQCVQCVQCVQDWQGSGTLEGSQHSPLRRPALTVASPRQARVIPHLPPRWVRVAVEAAWGTSAMCSSWWDGFPRRRAWGTAHAQPSGGPEAWGLLKNRGSPTRPPPLLTLPFARIPEATCHRPRPHTAMRALGA